MGSPGNVERRAERIVFETDRHLVIGTATLPQEGYQSRFSDSINRPEVDFLALTDVEIRPLDGGAAERRPFVVLNKGHVRLAYPAD